MLLIVETISWNPHVETAMEVALRGVENGTPVTYCNLRAGLPVCEDETLLQKLVGMPATRIRRSSSILRDRGVGYVRANYSKMRQSRASALAKKLLDQCATQDDLTKVSHGEFFDLGWGVLSSAASMTRDSRVSPASHAALTKNLLVSSVLVYEKTRSLIAEFRPDCVVLFNGRFATTRAVLRACQSMGTPWRIHERGRDKDHFWLVDFPPHDFEALQRHITLNRGALDDSAGHQFFRNLRDQVARSWISFTVSQKPGKLPVSVGRNTKLITFYTSSDDEWLAIGDGQRNVFYKDQFSAIGDVAKIVSEIPTCKLCVRIHPHIALKSKSDRRRWRELDIPNAIIVGPSETVDTYALLERSSVVCTYGSTIGVEATYWGRPSLLLGRSAYDQLGVCRVANGLEDIREFLTAPCVGDREAALAYGAFRSTLGERFKFYQATSLFDGAILGESLDRSISVNIYKLLKQANRRLAREVSMTFLSRGRSRPRDRRI